MSVIDFASGLLLGAGALFVVTGGVGLLRLPDFYTRTHAVAVTETAGTFLILLGLLVRTTAWGTGVRLLLILLFLAMTGPTATHALAQAARREGVPIWRHGDRRS